MTEHRQAGPGFIGELSSDALARLRDVARPQQFDRGTAMLSERQVGDRVMVIVDGRVKVSCTTDDGKDVVLDFRGAGDLVGEIAAIDGSPRSSSVVALEPVATLTLGTSDFRLLLADFPEVALTVMRMLTRRLREADSRRIEYSASDTVGRVAARLVELGERFGERDGDELVITLPLTQDDLAGWCGSSREATAKALQTMRDLGWIETARRRIIIRDLAAVASRSPITP